MSFKLNTYIRVIGGLEEGEKCVSVGKESTEVSIKDTHGRYQDVSFNFPKVFTKEPQVYYQ